MNRNRIHLQHVIRNQILCWGRISIRGKRGHVDDSNLYLNCVCVCVYAHASLCVFFRHQDRTGSLRPAHRLHDQTGEIAHAHLSSDSLIVFTSEWVCFTHLHMSQRRVLNVTQRVSAQRRAAWRLPGSSPKAQISLTEINHNWEIF